MKKRILPVLSLAFLGAFASCEKKEVEETAPTSLSAANSARSANLLYEEDLESSLFSTAHNIENNGTSWTLSSVTNPVYQGAKAARFEIQKGQTLVGSSKRVRSEVTIIKGTEYPNFPKDVWYSYSILFPAKGFEYDDTRDCINQWFEDGSDETTIRAQKDKAFLEVTPASGSSTLMKYDLFGTSSNGKSVDGFNNIPKDKWTQFVFHFVHSTGSDGLIEVWRDGVKIHTINGRNMHLMIPKWKIGLYKSSFLDGSSSRSSRVVYFDNVRVGNSNATYADMVGGTTTAPTPTPPTTTEPTTPPTTEPTPTPPTTTEPTPPTSPTTPAPATGVLSYTLVNSSTDKDIMTITNGAVINRKTLGVSKFNIRANTTAGSSVVKFVLSGKESKTRIDDVVPYALFGDDRNGDYNNWSASSGNYRLEANTYSGTKDKMGSATGTPYVINFTIQ
ncbi:polysaccharide lyase [Adhaeribacter sp. BT258]|uniref:Polysaccharide lyase n=1 Tax=Adhaeribacter terrigena TaxID=2793070 RepID=A0ABS1BXP0_9BACT|nr:heparin lyase I family protein [Adhaeribacter terrigena]MBK0401911.1 polysaccharide lyase [Adhaeribacter terrigena]